MAILLLKKSYRHKDLKEVKFHDLWSSHGVFTTMRVIGKPARILFFKNHINNLFKSLKVYKINKKNIKKNLFPFNAASGTRKLFNWSFFINRNF